MRVIFNECIDPYFNLASEEFLLENGCGDIFMIWRNEKSVIIGKNQNAYSEIDSSFCENHGINVVRRLTGGGAVFHDLGNVNFSFITDAPDEGGIDFYPYIERITSALSSFGVRAAANGRNDIEANGFKISGNAQCVYNCADGRKRLLHHGTLLFSADMTSLSGSLRVRADKMESKGIKSVRSRVANIRDIEGYTGPEDALEFALQLCRLCGGGDVSDLSCEEKSGIERLAQNKYSKWEWNYGESPQFSVEKTGRFPWGGIEISYTAKKGVIEEIRISGDFFAVGDIAELEGKLTGVSLEASALRNALCDADKYIHGAKGEELQKLMVEE